MPRGRRPPSGQGVDVTLGSMYQMRGSSKGEMKTQPGLFFARAVASLWASSNTCKTTGAAEAVSGQGTLLCHQLPSAAPALGRHSPHPPP